MSVLHAPDHQSTPTDVFECLTEPRRRETVAALVALDRPVTEKELATRLAEEREGTASDPETVRAALRHVHLPKLEALDLVAWDAAEGTVGLGANPITDDDRFRRLLADGDDRWAVTTAVHGDERRRAVVEALSAGDRTTRDELAADLAADADLPAERLAVQLHHVHLPKLADVGLLSYDAADGTVDPGADLDVPLFDRAAN